jgi:hypothetical protein
MRATSRTFPLPSMGFAGGRGRVSHDVVRGRSRTVVSAHQLIVKLGFRISRPIAGQPDR